MGDHKPAQTPPPSANEATLVLRLKGSLLGINIRLSRVTHLQYIQSIVEPLEVLEITVQVLRIYFHTQLLVDNDCTVLVDREALSTDSQVTLRFFNITVIATQGKTHW